MTTTKRMVFDVESMGLHGEGFAVGWVVLDGDHEVDWGLAACSHNHARGGTGDDAAWVAANVVPALPVPGFDIEDLGSPYEVRQAFWQAYQAYKAAGPVELWADCPWPVEARFLNACVDDDKPARNWQGPYPLLDVGVMMRASGVDAMATHPRLPGEEPAHNPLTDARQSARLLLEAERRLTAAVTAHLVPEATP